MVARSKKELLAEGTRERPQSARGIPSYGDAALMVFAGGALPKEQTPEAPTGMPVETQDPETPLVIAPVEPSTDGEKDATSRSKPQRRPKRLFVPDYRSPASNKTTKIREDQHQCMKEQVPQWIAEQFPEHPNLKRLVTLEFLTQLALDDLLGDEKLVERIVDRIQTSCLPK